MEGQSITFISTDSFFSVKMYIQAFPSLQTSCTFQQNEDEREGTRRFFVLLLESCCNAGM